MKWAFIAENDLASLEREARFAALHGYSGLEFNYWHTLADLPETLDQRKAILEQYGLRVSALGLWGLNYMAPDAAERDKARAVLRAGIDAARRYRADHMILGGGEIPNAPLEKQIEAFVAWYTPVREELNTAGIVPVFSALHGANFIKSIDAYVKLWENIPDAWIKFDPANWLAYGDDYLAVASAHAAKIGYIHVKEHCTVNGTRVAEPPAGMGDIAWGKLMGFLHAAGYTGYLSVEPHGKPWGQGTLREKNLILSKKYISQFLLG